MLRCVVECCRVLQSVAECCKVLQEVAECIHKYLCTDVGMVPGKTSEDTCTYTYRYES